MHNKHVAIAQNRWSKQILRYRSSTQILSLHSPIHDIVGDQVLYVPSLCSVMFRIQLPVLFTVATGPVLMNSIENVN